MNYNIGQFRRGQLALSRYKTSFSSSLTNYLQDEFQDLAINCYTSLKNNNCYYLNFSIQQVAFSQTITLSLTNETKDRTQYLEKYTVPAGSGKVNYEIAFSPNSTYTKVIFTLNRDLNNYNRTPTIKVDNFYQITDLMDSLKSSYSDLNYITKIGVQGPTGLLLMINQEPIKIGRNQVYELENENIKIKSFGVVLKENAKQADGYDSFILDFLYNDEGGN